MTRSQLLKQRKAQGPPDELPYMTAKDLVHSGIAGMWKNRKDIRSTAAFARQLRDRLSKRSTHRV